MKTNDPKFNSHPLFLTYLAARDAFNKAMIARDAIAECGSKAWFVAHNKAGDLAAAAHIAEQACYDTKIAYAPYWHVTPKQMASYAKTSRGDFS